MVFGMPFPFRGHLPCVLHAVAKLPNLPKVLPKTCCMPVAPSFSHLCQEYATWVIRLCLPGLEKDVFLIWYANPTDDGTDHQDQFLTFTDGKIFATESESLLKTRLSESWAELVVPDKLVSWLEHIDRIESSGITVFDMKAVENQLASNNQDIPVLETLIDFINLFHDFAEQDQTNMDLKAHLDQGLIDEVWNYFYDYIFWPRFNDKEKFASWDRPESGIDSGDLLEQVRVLTASFKKSIRLVT